MHATTLCTLAIWASFTLGSGLEGTYHVHTVCLDPFVCTIVYMFQHAFLGLYPLLADSLFQSPTVPL